MMTDKILKELSELGDILQAADDAVIKAYHRLTQLTKENDLKKELVAPEVNLVAHVNEMFAGLRKSHDFLEDAVMGIDSYETLAAEMADDLAAADIAEK